MRSISVNISPSIADWVLETAVALMVDNELLSHCYKWKTAEEKPTFAQIEKLSKKTHIPLGYFFLETPPAEIAPVFEYRTINSASAENPSRELLDTYYQMSAIQDWMRDYLLENGHEKLPYAGSLKQEKNISLIAESIRTAAGLKPDWYSGLERNDNSFKFLRTSFENIGILVLQNGIAGNNTRRKLDINEFRAFTLIDEFAPLIFINNNDANNGKTFSLLHEAAHIWIGLHSFYNYNYEAQLEISPLETMCNAAAAEILVPNNHFAIEWKNKEHIQLQDKIERLAKIFKCSRIVITRRALDNAFISQADYQRLKDIFFAAPVKPKRKNKKFSSDFYNMAKSRYGLPLIRALDHSVKEGKTLYTEAYELIRANRYSFAELAAKLGRSNEYRRKRIVLY